MSNPSSDSLPPGVSAFGASISENTANWREGLPLLIDSYSQERYSDTKSAIIDVLSHWPTFSPSALSQSSPQPSSAAPSSPLVDAYEHPRAMTPLPQLPATVPRVYGLCGQPQAGKDVVADYLTTHYAGVQRFAFSQAIFEEVNQYLLNFKYEYGGVARTHHISEATKSLPGYRHLLQAWGMARREERADYWTCEVAREAQQRLTAGARLVVITGARMPTDVQVIHELGGTVLRVIRPGNPYQTVHPVESGLDHLPDDAFVSIINPVEGELAPYEQNIEALLHGRE